jgi:hypothetical protein
MEPAAVPKVTNPLDNTLWEKTIRPLFCHEADVMDITGVPTLPSPANHMLPLLVNRNPTKL